MQAIIKQADVEGYVVLCRDGVNSAYVVLCRDGVNIAYVVLCRNGVNSASVCPPASCP